MNKCLATVMAVLLAVCMIPLAACSSQEAEGEALSAESTDVTFDASGQYTTTLTPRSGVSMKDLTAADIQVFYTIPDALVETNEQSTEAENAAADAETASSDAANDETADPTETQPEGASPSAETATENTTATDEEQTAADAENANAAETDQTATDASTNTSDDENNGEGIEIPLSTFYAEVQSLEVADDGSATLTFTDPLAQQYMTVLYCISAANSDFASQVAVNYPTYTLTPDPAYVSADAQATRLTLVLDDGEFTPDMTAEDVALSGSFASMTIESLSAAGKNLTLQLVGAPTETPEAGVYLDGTIAISPLAITHASEVTHVNVPVHVDGASFGYPELKVDGNTVSVPLTIYGVEDLASLTPESFTFADQAIKVQSVEPSGDTTLSLKLEVSDVDSANAAAAKLNDQEVTVGDIAFTANFPDATFWPVFDYVGDAGDNLAITLNAMAANGTFADDISADDVALSDGFEGGAVSSVKRTGDTTAEIQLTVPAGGQTAESVNLTGTVTLAAGALVNAWGEAAAEETSITRDYSQESLGREIDDLPEILIEETENVSKLTQFVEAVNNSTFMKACSALGTVGSVASGAVGVANLLTLIGVLPDKQDQLAEAMKQIDSKLDTVHDIMMEQSSLMNRIAKTQYEDRVAGFKDKFSDLQNIDETAARYFAEARRVLKEQGFPEPDNSFESLAPSDDNPLAGKSFAEQNRIYNARLTDTLLDGDHARGPFDGFTRTMDRVVSSFDAVVRAVTSNSNYSNAIYNYDYLCSLTYNFDSQANAHREAFRADIKNELKSAMSAIELRYDAANNPNSPQITQSQSNYNKALDAIYNRRVQYNSQGILFYIPNVWVYRDFQSLQKGLTIAGGPSAKDYEYAEGVFQKYAIEAIGGYGNLTEMQQEEFVKRMNGRTGLQELQSAGFEGLNLLKRRVALYEVSGHPQADVLGLCLSATHAFKKRSILQYDWETYTANYVPLDKSELVKNYDYYRNQYAGGNYGWCFFRGTVVHFCQVGKGLYLRQFMRFGDLSTREQ